MGLLRRPRPWPAHLGGPWRGAQGGRGVALCSPGQKSDECSPKKGDPNVIVTRRNISHRASEARLAGRRGPRSEEEEEEEEAGQKERRRRRRAAGPGGGWAGGVRSVWRVARRARHGQGGCGGGRGQRRFARTPGSWEAGPSGYEFLVVMRSVCSPIHTAACQLARPARPRSAPPGSPLLLALSSLCGLSQRQAR